MPVHPTATFSQPGDFAAVHAAERACKEAGFSIGIMQARASRGLLLGDVTIAKWRNMSAADKSALHGQMWGGRDGPVTVMLHADAPAPAVIAFQAVLAAASTPSPATSERDQAPQASDAIPLASPSPSSRAVPEARRAANMDMLL